MPNRGRRNICHLEVIIRKPSGIRSRYRTVSLWLYGWVQGEDEVLVLLSSAHDVRDGNDGARCSCLRPDLERKHHFDCSIFQKNIRFIAHCFIVFCLIFLSNDAEKEIMRQQDQNTGRLRTPTAIAGKTKPAPA